MRDLLQEKDRTREAVSQIVSWCLVIALHQTEGIGKKRQDDVAAKALVIQEAAAKRLARQSREEVIAWLRSKLDRLDLPDGALTFRVPLRRAGAAHRRGSGRHSYLADFRPGHPPSTALWGTAACTSAYRHAGKLPSVLRLGA